MPSKVDWEINIAHNLAVSSQQPGFDSPSRLKIKIIIKMKVFPLCHVEPMDVL